MTASKDLIDEQARQLTYYLIKKEPSELEIELYRLAVAGDKVNVSLKDKRLFDFIAHHNWSIGLIDSGLAMIEPHSEIRRRLFIMFSILECMPERYYQFIPKRHSAWYWLVVIYSGLSSTLKATIGCALIKTID